LTEASLAELQARVQLHDDERSIVRVLYRYAHALYAGERTDFLACWTEDAEFEHVRHGQRYVGQDQLGEFFDGVSHAPDAFHKHVVIEPMIEVSGDEARCVSDFLFVQDLPSRGGPYISHFGRYIDRLVRGDDGRWRLARRRVFTEGAAAGPGVSATTHTPDDPEGSAPRIAHPGPDD